MTSGVRVERGVGGFVVVEVEILLEGAVGGGVRRNGFITLILSTKQ